MPAEHDAIEILFDVGLRCRITGARDIEIERPDGGWDAWELKFRRRPPSPSDLEFDRAFASAPRVLYVVPHVSPSLRERAVTYEGIGYIDLGAREVVINGRLHVSDASDREPAVPTRSRRRPWARLAVMRVLVLTPRPLTQVDIAVACGVTQAAVSNSLKALGESVDRIDGGWVGTDRVRLWDWFLEKYPGPGGLPTYWASIAPPDRQLQGCSRAARGMSSLLSGDWAADRYAPWRRPDRIVILAESQARLEQERFAQSSAATATVEWRVPADPTVWHTARWFGGDGDENDGVFVLADPMVVAWDMVRGAGSDVAESVNALRRVMVGGR